MKVRLVDDSCIHFPIAVCEPLNADFDGDCVSIQLVDEKTKEDTIRKMSPRYVTYYKKNFHTIKWVAKFILENYIKMLETIKSNQQSRNRFNDYVYNQI